MNKKILIVDDEPYIRVLLEQTLEELGEENVELLLAADGKEAIELALNERPALVFLDVMMPELSGYKVCQRIKAVDSTICVILLTAKGQEVDKKRGAEAGADEYITKPFDLDYILDKAATILGLEKRL